MLDINVVKRTKVFMVTMAQGEDFLDDPFCGLFFTREKALQYIKEAAEDYGVATTKFNISTEEVQ